jgi:hypothetical protein
MIFPSKDSIYLGFGTVFTGFIYAGDDITEKITSQLKKVIKDQTNRDICISIEDDYFHQGYYNYIIRVYYPLLEGDYLKKYINYKYSGDENTSYLEKLLHENDKNDKYINKNIENSVKNEIDNIIKNTKFTPQEIELMNTIVKEFEGCEPYWFVATDYECDSLMSD